MFQLRSVREQLKDFTKQYDKSENDLKALQSVGQVRYLIEIMSGRFFLEMQY